MSSKPKLKFANRNKNAKPRNARIKLHETLALPNGTLERVDGVVTKSLRPPRSRRPPNFKGPLKRDGSWKMPSPSPAPPLERPLHGAFNSPILAHPTGLNSNYEVASWAPELSPFGELRQTGLNLADPVGGLPVHLVTDEDNVPTEAAKTGPLLLNLPIYNGASTAADGSFAFIIRGDSYGTIIRPATISASHAVTWTGGTLLSTYAPYTVQYYSRIITSYARLRFYCVGDPHNISLSAFRIQPQGVSGTMSVGCTYTNVGCTENQLRAFGGFDTTMAPGAIMTFQCNQAQSSFSRSQFMQIGSERGTNSNAGWCIFGYGLKSTDRLALDYGSYFECMSYTDAPLNINTVGNVRSSAVAADAIESIMGASASQPTYSATDSIWDRMIGAASTAINKFAQITSNSDVIEKLSPHIRNLWGIGTPFVMAVRPADLRSKIHPGYYKRGSDSPPEALPQTPTPVREEEEEKFQVEELAAPRIRTRSDSVAMPLSAKR